MARRKRKTTKKSTRRAAKGPKPLKRVKVGQRVRMPVYGEGTVIAVECRRGFYYSDAWVRPDDGSVYEVGLRYDHGIYKPEEQHAS